jgi:hypothetical protein
MKACHHSLRAVGLGCDLGCLSCHHEAVICHRGAAICHRAAAAIRRHEAVAICHYEAAIDALVIGKAVGLSHGGSETFAAATGYGSATGIGVHRRRHPDRRPDRRPDRHPDEERRSPPGGSYGRYLAPECRT